jgi:hypothetical protein
MANKYHAIFGTGPLGLAIMDQLIQEDKKVLLVNRSGKADVPQSVKVIKGDATKLDSVLEICNSYELSVIYHCLGLPYPLWPELFPMMMDNIIEAADHKKLLLKWPNSLRWAHNVVEISAGPTDRIIDPASASNALPHKRVT